MSKLETLFKKFELSKEHHTLFEKYELTKEQIGWFGELRPVAPKDVSDEYLVWCILVRSDIQGVQKILQSFSEVIRNHNWGKVHIEKIHVDHMIQNYFFVDDRIRGVNGEVVAFGKLDGYFKAKKVPQQIVKDCHMHFIDTLCRGNKETHLKGLILVCDFRNFSIWSIPWELHRIMAPLAQSVPLRVKKIICFCPPSWFSIALTIAKPFLSKKMQERVVTCRNPEELKKCITALPAELGGTLKPKNKFHALRDVFCRTDRERNLVKQLAVDEMKELMFLSKKRVHEKELKELEEKKKRMMKQKGRKKKGMVPVGAPSSLPQQIQKISKVMKDSNLSDEVRKKILEEISKNKDLLGEDMHPSSI